MTEGEVRITSRGLKELMEWSHFNLAILAAHDMNALCGFAVTSSMLMRGPNTNALVLELFSFPTVRLWYDLATKLKEQYPDNHDHRRACAAQVLNKIEDL